jgi:hypothetical protein
MCQSIPENRSLTEMEVAYNNREVNRQKQEEGRRVMQVVAEEKGWDAWAHDGRSILLSTDKQLANAGEGYRVSVKLPGFDRKSAYRVNIFILQTNGHKMEPH